MSTPRVTIEHLNHIDWLDEASCSYTVAGTNHIWRINISTNIQYIDKLWGLLSADEHERANRYYREKDKLRFTVARGVLRILLGRYLDVNAKQIVFETGENKKPHVNGNASLSYNVSHSGNYILIAFSNAEVGVDVEQPDIDMHYEEIMQISYSEAEIDFVMASSNPLQAFYLLWTRKEALLKATGKGIDDALKFVPAVDGVHASMFNIIGSQNSWYVQSFKVDDTHQGSVAASGSQNIFMEFQQNNSKPAFKA